MVHYWCNFCSSDKTLRGEKILSPRYILLGARGAIAPLAPGIDVTDHRSVSFQWVYCNSDALCLYIAVVVVGLDIKFPTLCHKFHLIKN